ncbi:MAG TPA: hypothetical protein VKB69_08325 [Micromonosporaceae bacterium]|nr:hypothetical protein [Micromonosporaceae bacterium]
MTTWAVLGLAAALVSTVDAVPYVRDILRGSTRPHRGTWCIWSMLGVVAFFAQLADGPNWSLLMVGVQAASMAFVFALSVRRGVGSLGPVDLALMGVAVLGIIGWYASSEPIVATACVVVADLAGVLLMLPKVWRDPGSETPSSFAMAAASGFLATAAVGALDPALLLYPAYFGVVNAATAALIVARRRVLSRQKRVGEALHRAAILVDMPYR